MWNGKDTKELTKLKKKYEDMFGYNPDGLLGVEYDQEDYEEYVSDLKHSIKTHEELEEYDDERY